MGRKPSIPSKELILRNSTTVPITGCWMWMGTMMTNSCGMHYGQVSISGKMRLAHRVSYEVSVGIIPEGLVIDHLCRNSWCVNPDHLEPVSIRENVLRGVGITAVNARMEYCRRGHRFDEANTHIDDARGGARSCRACRSSRAAARFMARSRSVRTQ